MKFLMAAIMTISIMFMAGTASATYYFRVCDILKIQTNSDGKTYVRLKCPGVVNRTFFLHADIAETGLATLISAVALGLQVEVHVDWQWGAINPILSVELLVADE